MKYLSCLLVLISAQSFALCEEWKPGSTMYSGCLIDDLKRKSEGSMNEQYEFLLKEFSKSSQYEAKLNGLKESQEKWEKYKKHQCDLEQSVFGGSNSISWGECNSRLIHDRQKEIESIYNVYTDSDVN